MNAPTLYRTVDGDTMNESNLILRAQVDRLINNYGDKPTPAPRFTVWGFVKDVLALDG